MVEERVVYLGGESEWVAGAIQSGTGLCYFQLNRGGVRGRRGFRGRGGFRGLGLSERVKVVQQTLTGCEVRTHTG